MRLYQSVFFGMDILTAELIEAFLKYRKDKKAEDLQTPEWKTLEQEYLAHLRWRFQYPRKIFGQQMYISWVISTLVIGLVVAGVVFAFLQLQHALSVGDFSALKTELEVSTAGKVTMSSSIIGAVVLVVSLLFFNLYLKYVFQIKHPVPPHVSLSETDANKLWRRIEMKVEQKMREASSSSESTEDEE